MNEIKMQKSTMQERDNLLRKEGFINGENAIARMIENNLSILAKLSGKTLCKTLIEVIKEQTEEQFKQLEKDAAELNKKIDKEMGK